MRKKISYVLSLLAMLFVLPACQQQSDVEEATLDLSTQTLTFAKEANPHPRGEYAQGACRG